MTTRLHAALERKAVLLADGAMATNLFARGLKVGEMAEFWNLSAADEVASLHRAFIDAGADILLTNSFGANRYRLRRQGGENDADALNIAAARIARSVADAAPREILVAGSMGPLGETVSPAGPVTPDAAIEAFSRQAHAIAAGGVDLLWIETLSSREELAAALKAAQATGLPVIATLSFHQGAREADALRPDELPHILHNSPHPPTAFGSNCGDGPREALHHLLAITAAGKPGDILAVKANCGLLECEGGILRYPATTAMMADYARLATDLGARIVGGCCGTTPGHLKAMADAISSHTAVPKPDAARIDAALGRPGGA